MWRRWILAMTMMSTLAGCGDRDDGDDDAAPTQCMYNGGTYDLGEQFPAVDGCNTCYCADAGAVPCTIRACLDGGDDAPVDAPVDAP